MAEIEARLKALMLRALAGDSASYEALLRALAPALRGYFSKRLGAHAQDAEDLVQEALMAMHTRRMSYDRDLAILPWIYAIARHKLVDRFRKVSRSGHVELREESRTTSFEAEILARIDIERLLDGLPEKQQATIRATKIEGLSVAEAAGLQGLSESDVKVSVHRGLKSIAARIQGK